MDFALNDDQQMLRDGARKFFARECPRALVRGLRETPGNHSPAVWAKMADLGWVGLPFPGEFGGAGMQFLDLAVILEEMGRSLLPSPFLPTVILSGGPILEIGSTAQKNDLLPRLAAGELILTMALLETKAVYDPGAISTTARPDGDGYVLDGRKLFVPGAQIADRILTVARTPGAGAGQDTIFLVDRQAQGLEIRRLPSLDQAGLCEVSCKGVRVPAADVLGKVNGASAAIAKALAHAAIAECLQMLGAGEAALEMAVAHAKDRVQFGVPIGSFQAVQHHCANMYIDLTGMRFLCFKAAWKLSQQLPGDAEVALCKAWVSDAAVRVVATAHQVLGGTGFIMEHNMPLFFLRTNAASVNYGDSVYQYSAAARALGY